MEENMRIASSKNYVLLIELEWRKLCQGHYSRMVWKNAWTGLWIGVLEAWGYMLDCPRCFGLMQLKMLRTWWTMDHLFLRMDSYQRRLGAERILISERAFGCVTYVHIDLDAISKLDPKSKKCIFIGYGNDEFGYRFWDESKNHLKQMKKWCIRIDLHHMLKSMSMLN